MRVIQIYAAILLGCCYVGLSLPQRNGFEDRPQFLKFNVQDVKGYNLKNRRNYVANQQVNHVPTGFRNPSGSAQQESSEEDDASPAPSQQLRRPFEGDNYPNSIPQIRQPSGGGQAQQYRRPSQPPQQFRKQLEEEKELEEADIEEPDRLSLLLPNSKFDCGGKNTGYYADEGLQCEVFHYCQEGTKHSWICPEGFTFHQVHLICMPPSGDNICQKSSEYHFVNEYLYKPLNQDEANAKPNVTLRYSDRYYPENYNYAPQESNEEEYQPPRRQPQPVQVQFRRPPSPQPTHFSPTLRPEAHIPVQFRPSSQVFHSPEEVNISLQQRRPLLIAQPKQNYPSQPTGFDFQK